MGIRWAIFAISCLFLTSPSLAQQSPFYVYPISTIDGLTNATDNALIDPRVREILGEDAVRKIADTFVKSTADAFKGAVVSGTQVRESFAVGASYRYMPVAECSDDRAFSVPIKRAYAAVLGITRGSIYTVDKKGVTELLIPVTLNLQIWKPEKSKIAFSVADTIYTPFRFATSEVQSPAAKALIQTTLLENINQQVAFLVRESAKSFKPKESVIKVLGKDGAYVVVDGGMEAGFSVADGQISGNLLGRPGATGDDEIIFEVISAVSGYAILKPASGGATPAQVQVLRSGAQLRFEFESDSDDSEKPVLLPITGFDAASADENSAAEIFSKSVGFASKFQILTVSRSATETHQIIKNQTRCASWDKYDVKAQGTQRKDMPSFFAKFDLQQTDVLRKEGDGGVKTEDEFAVLASVKLLDQKMNVHYSEVAVEPYRLTKTAGQGLQEKNAVQVATKNALLRLSANFAKDAKLESRELRIAKVDGPKLWVPAPGITLEQLDAAKLSFYRELTVVVGGKKVLLPLRLGESSAMELVGSDLVATFSKIDNEYVPKAGDLVRFAGLSKPAALKIARCEGEDFVSDRTVIKPKFASVFIENAINASPRLQMQELTEGLDVRINTLLSSGMFRADIKSAQRPVACFQPGFAIRVDTPKCEAGFCNASVLNGLITRFRLPAGQKDIQAAQRTAVEGVPEVQRDQYLSLQSMVWFNQLQSELKKKLVSFP